MTFIKYVHEHLLQKAQDVVRLGAFVCPHCGHPVRDTRLVREILNEEGPNAESRCQQRKCDKRLSLWDVIERLKKISASFCHNREVIRVNIPLTDAEEKRIQVSVRRRRRLESLPWTQIAAAELGLLDTLSRCARPRIFDEPPRV